MPPSSISMSGWVVPCASRQGSRSPGCTATGASSRLATSKAAATCLWWPWVQITAATSRSPTTSSTAPADSPGSITMTSSSSPMIQVFTSPTTRSMRASMRAIVRPRERPLMQTRFDQRAYRVHDQLHGYRGKQQASDPGEQLNTGPLEHSKHDAGEPHREPEQDDHCDDRGGEGYTGTDGSDPLHEQHGRHDRARAGQQRRAEGHEGYIGRRLRELGRLGGLAGQQLERDQEQQQPAR